MRKFILFCLFFAANFLANAQDTKNSSTLLWRISGNNLKKPSYLYGTMHLTDKRVFMLGDSVYNALEQSEGFAAELDMNRLGTQMVNEFIKESADKKSKAPVYVKDIVSKETWNYYKKELEKKFNKKADKITVDDLDDIEKKLQMEMFKQGEMPSFLDAWLFGLAGKQGKWVGGVEDFEDQMEHLAAAGDAEDKIHTALFDDKYFRSSLDRFVKIYTSQNLDSIDAFMYRESSGKKDYIIIKRNIKMAGRMDSLAAIRSTLFAVGAAHLPGDSGVIELLRKKGFTVTPVTSSKKIDPDKYVSTVKARHWIPVNTKDSSYFLAMPGIAEPVDIYESVGLDMKLFFDITTMRMYMTMTMEIPEERKKVGLDSIYRAMRNHYAANGRMLGEKDITVNGNSGREYRMAQPEGEIKMQIFVPAMERLVLNAVFGFNEKSVGEAESQKFFQSFVYNQNLPKKTASPNVWSRTSFPVQSFSVEMPVKPVEKKDLISEEGKIVYTWQGYDMKTQIFYGIRVSLMKEGMYESSDDTTYFITVKDNLKKGFASVNVIDSGFTSVNGYPAYQLTLNGKAEGDFLETSVINVARGGINYYLYAVYKPADQQIAAGKKFLNSLQLLPYKHTGWKTNTSPNNLFATTSSFSFNKRELAENDIHPNSERYIMYDSVAAVTAYIDKSSLPKWYWHSSDTAFLRKRAAEYSTYNDSVADYKIFKAGSLNAVSFTVLSKTGNHIVKKVQLIVNGNELYEIFGHLAYQDLNEFYNKFYTDFKVVNEKKSNEKGISKAAELADEISKADKKSTDEIKQWWDYVDFSKGDIPALQKMAFKLHADFDTTYYYSNLNTKIFEKIEELDSNHTTIEFIKANYSSITSANEYIKPFIISYLSDIKTIDSYSLLKEFLLKNPFEVEKAPYYPHSLNDSLKLTAALFPEIMELADKESMWELVSEMTATLFDSSLIDKASIIKYSKKFIDVAERNLAANKNEEEEYFNYNDLISVLEIINSPESNALLTKFSKVKSNETKFRAVIAMLINKLPVDTKIIAALAATDAYRHDLYDQLKKIDKLTLFPLIQLTQKQLGKSILYAYATDEEAPESITDISVKTIMYKGKQQKFYLYKVNFSDEVSYLGVAGPYSLNIKDMTSKHELTGVYWENEYNSKRVDAFFKEYITSMEEENEEE